MFITIETFETFQNELDNKLILGLISMHEYRIEWCSLLHVLGWSEQKYAEEIDRRWNYLHALRIPTNEKHTFN